MSPPSPFPSSAAVKLVCAHDMPPPLMLGHNNIILKHILEPADSVPVEQVSTALRQSDPVTGAGGEERKAILVAPVKTGQLVSGGVPTAAGSANVVDGRKAAHIGADDQETADSSDPCSDRMAFIGDGGERKVRSAHTYAPSSLEKGEVAMGRVASPSPGTVGDGADRGEHAPAAERKDARLGVASPRVPFGEHIPSSALQDNPIGSSTSSSSSTSTSSDTNGERDLYEIGVAAALAMDTEELRSEMARYFGQEAKREQRPQRRARQRNAPAPPVKFSLRLSEEEAMEDVAAVSLAKDDVKLEAEGIPVRRNAKRRRH